MLSVPVFQSSALHAWQPALPDPHVPGCGAELSNSLIRTIRHVDPAHEATLTEHEQQWEWMNNQNPPVLAFSKNAETAHRLAPPRLKTSPLALLAEISGKPSGIGQSPEVRKLTRYAFLSNHRGDALIYEITHEGISEHLQIVTDWKTGFAQLLLQASNNLKELDIDYTEIRATLNQVIALIHPNILVNL